MCSGLERGLQENRHEEVAEHIVASDDERHEIKAGVQVGRRNGVELHPRPVLPSRVRVRVRVKNCTPGQSSQQAATRQGRDRGVRVRGPVGGRQGGWCGASMVNIWKTVIMERKRLLKLLRPSSRAPKRYIPST